MAFFVAFHEMIYFLMHLISVLGVGCQRNDKTTAVAHVHGHNIWMWDLYCRLQPVKGTCNQDLYRYYYEAQSDACRLFNYTGCNGNPNNFVTKIDCERRCKGVNFMDLNENSLPTICYLQPDSGMCLFFMVNFYYDLEAGRCKEFTYGGCGGNLNRFETNASCNEYCTVPSEKQRDFAVITETETTSAKKLRTDLYN